MNITAIKYGRIKRQAPEMVIVKADDIKLVLDRMRNPDKETQIKPTIHKSIEVWQARHSK